MRRGNLSAGRFRGSQRRGVAALRRAAAAILIGSSLSLAGCGGDSGALLTASGVTGPTTASSRDSNDASPYGTNATAQPAPFNPFAADGTTERPRREVIASPTLADVLKTGPLPEFSLGRPDAPVVMVKYMSLTCPYCRRFMAETFPVLKREYIDTGKLRFIIREFPIGKTSGNATIALRCAPMDKYLPLYRKFLEQQSAWVSQEVRPDAIMKVAQQVGLTRQQFDACVKDQPMIDGLKWVKERGRDLGVIGTPNFFIGNRLFKSVLTMPEIRAIVDPMVAGRGSAGKAG
ncbi:MAG: DsbA family protein [Hyphomicrobiaceae bacterium]